MSDAIPSPTLLRLSDTDHTILNEAEDVRGHKVVDSNGEDLGKVADLLIDDVASHVRFLVVEHGGLLGIGASQNFLPVEMITDYTDDEVFVGTSAETISGAPEYDPDLGISGKYYADVYGYYGYSPYWTPNADPRSPWYGHG